MAFESDLGQSGRMASVDVTDARNAATLALPADSRVVLYCC